MRKSESSRRRFLHCDRGAVEPREGQIASCVLVVSSCNRAILRAAALPVPSSVKKARPIRRISRMSADWAGAGSASEYGPSPVPGVVAVAAVV